MAINKVIFGNETLIDLTSDTVDAAHLLTGKTAHDKSGAVINGACTYDADTSDATASADEILATKSAYVNGSKLTGTMPNRGAVTGSISDLSTPYVIQNGYHDGSGEVGISSTEAAKIIPANIRKDIEILGVTGTMSGDEDVHAQSKTATPYTTQQVITPDQDYNYLTQVTVEAIAYTETDNAAGGKTATIGTVAPVAPVTP